jgi:serine/threonine protein kinase, bacterial
MKRTQFLIIAVAVVGSLMMTSCTKPLNYAAQAAKIKVTTLAGTGAIGSANGPNMAASFSSPYSITVDGLGNVYVGEVGNYMIRIISPIWGVSLFAQYYPVDSSEIDPSGLAMDAAGNLYVSDNSIAVILKYNPSGVLTTLAGNFLNQGWNDGTGTAASFGEPNGLAVDAAGNVYVADNLYSMIRKISPSGVVTTLAGSSNKTGCTDGTGTAATFWNPLGIAVNASGTIYVADEHNNVIRQISPSGVVTTLAGNSHVQGYVDGVGINALFNSPSGIAVDRQGYIYVTDSRNNMIRKIDPGGGVTTFAGNGQAGSTDGLGSGASFNTPIGIAVDSSGTVYVADEGNNLIRKISQ